jgi:hypothetical protein
MDGRRLQIENTPYEVLFEPQFNLSCDSERNCSTFETTAKKFNALTSRGMEVNNVTILDFLLRDAAISLIQKCITQMLVKMKQP